MILDTFFATAYNIFQQAVCRPVVCKYLIGECPVHLYFANQILVSIITPAIKHLATQLNESESPLRICIWDSVSTGMPVPVLPWKLDHRARRHRISSGNDSRYHMTFDAGTGVINLLDKQQRLALCWMHDARQLPAYEISAPLLKILHGWMPSRGRQVVHAAAVGTPTGGVLLAGRGGAGKSTTALACLDSELLYVSDDYCLLALKPAPYAYSLYNSGKLDAASLQRLPHLASYVRHDVSANNEKAVLFLHEHCPKKVITGFPLRAILLPCISNQAKTSLRRASPAEGLRALAPSTLFQLTGTETNSLRNMAELMRLIPCYYLELGNQMNLIPEVIEQLIAEV